MSLFPNSKSTTPCSSHDPAAAKAHTLLRSGLNAAAHASRTSPRFTHAHDRLSRSGRSRLRPASTARTRYLRHAPQPPRSRQVQHLHCETLHYWSRGSLARYALAWTQQLMSALPSFFLAHALMTANYAATSVHVCARRRRHAPDIFGTRLSHHAAARCAKQIARVRPVINRPRLMQPDT